MKTSAIRGTIVAEFVDEGVSGAKGRQERRQFDALLNADASLAGQQQPRRRIAPKPEGFHCDKEPHIEVRSSLDCRVLSL